LSNRAQKKAEFEYKKNEWFENCPVCKGPEALAWKDATKQIYLFCSNCGYESKEDNKFDELRQAS